MLYFVCEYLLHNLIKLLIYCIFEEYEFLIDFLQKFRLNYASNIAIGPSLVCARNRICPRGDICYIETHTTVRYTIAVARNAISRIFFFGKRANSRRIEPDGESSSTLEFASASRLTPHASRLTRKEAPTLIRPRNTPPPPFQSGVFRDTVGR